MNMLKTLMITAIEYEEFMCSILSLLNKRDKKLFNNYCKNKKLTVHSLKYIYLLLSKGSLLKELIN